MQNVKGIDLFIDGHSHTVMTASKDNNMVQSTGTGLAYVGAIVIDNATKSIESNGLIDLSAYTKEDATVKAAADKIISDINAEYTARFLPEPTWSSTAPRSPATAPRRPTWAT